MQGHVRIRVIDAVALRLMLDLCSRRTVLAWRVCVIGSEASRPPFPALLVALMAVGPVARPSHGYVAEDGGGHDDIAQAGGRE